MKHMTRIERIIPYLMDGLAALAGGFATSLAVIALVAVYGDVSTAKSIAGAFLVATSCGAFLAVRIARASIHPQVHMELAEGGK